MLDMCGLSEDSDGPRAGKHRELERTEIQKSEDAVQRTILVIQNFTPIHSQFQTKIMYAILLLVRHLLRMLNMMYYMQRKLEKKQNRALFVNDLLQLGLKLNFWSQSKNKN